MKILNLYAGIGGNRKLWGDQHKITAVEYDKDIAAIYKDFFPNDEVLVEDAHEYLLNHYKDYDFIWCIEEKIDCRKRSTSPQIKYYYISIDFFQVIK